MQQRAPDYWVTCSGREIARAGRRGPGAGQPHGHQHCPLVTTTITIYRGLPGNLARALLTIHCSVLATSLYVAEVHDLFSARAVMAWRRLAESRSHMLFLHVGGAGCGCGLEAARSSVFEIFSVVWSAAVWAAALSGQQPWPWLRCVATAAPTLRPCVHLSPLSSVQLSTLVAAPWPTPTQHLAAGWASLRTLAAPVHGLLRPSIGQPLSETDCRPTLSPSGGRGHPQVKLLLLLLASPHNGTGGGDV